MKWQIDEERDEKLDEKRKIKIDEEWDEQAIWKCISQIYMGPRWKDKQMKRDEGPCPPIGMPRNVIGRLSSSMLGLHGLNLTLRIISHGKDFKYFQQKKTTLNL